MSTSQGTRGYLVTNSGAVVSAVGSIAQGPAIGIWEHLLKALNLPRQPHTLKVCRELDSPKRCSTPYPRKVLPGTIVYNLPYMPPVIDRVDTQLAAALEFSEHHLADVRK